MQKDLFGSATITALPSQFEQKSDFLDRYKITLKLDQTLVVAISLIVLFVLVFSYGVESGKRYAMAEIKSERAKRERMAQELGEKIFANQASVAKVKSLPAVSVAGAEMKSPAMGQPEKASPAQPAAATPAMIQTGQPAPASAEPQASTPARPAGRFGIQVVTITSKAAAEREVQKLSQKGYAGALIPAASGKFFHVCVTGYGTRSEANKALLELKAKKLAPQDAYLRNIA